MGGRPAKHFDTFLLICFNPRPHVGGRRTYALPDVWTDRFNPRPHVGGRLGVGAGGVATGLFQSTPPRGGATV
mgnify:CR=1 FL=1